MDQHTDKLYVTKKLASKGIKWSVIPLPCLSLLAFLWGAGQRPVEGEEIPYVRSFVRLSVCLAG